MGMRSQIYVRFDGEDKKGLIANYYGWNFGERMISRASWGIAHILDSLNFNYDLFYADKTNVKKLSRVFDVNFDLHDVAISCDIIAEYNELFSDEDFNNCVFKEQDNNDGKLFVDIHKDGVKYAFLDSDADTDNIMDAEAYMCWDIGEEWRNNLSEDEVKTCEGNIKYISENATLMTKEEIEAFIAYDYTGEREHSEKTKIERE